MNLQEALDWWDDNPYADPDEAGPIIAAARAAPTGQWCVWNMRPQRTG